MKTTVKLISFFALIISLAGVVLWQIFLADKVNYYVTSVSILLISMLPFFVGFEIKNASAKEITLVATLIALAVASRAAFYLVPQVKPIGAVVIVSAVCLGAERGYIIGAFSAFISNFIFGQGYWTPFQMVALGTVGLVAGLILKAVKVNRISLSIVGFLLTFAVYGIIVDLSTVLMMSGENLSLKSALTVYASGVPFSLVFGISTAIFLFIFGEAFINKLNRINAKYDIAK